MFSFGYADIRFVYYDTELQNGVSHVKIKTIWEV